MIEMHISEIGFCSGHSASGVWVNEWAATTVPGLYAAGDMASVPHNYMLGAFVNGGIAGQTAAAYCAEVDLPGHDAADVAAEQERVLAPTRREDGLTPHEMEFKTRRLVNDYLQPPKITAKFNIGQERLAEVREDLGELMARDPHELMRALETQSILDCADLAAAASLYRTESRWGLYHLRVDYPETDNENWFCHSMHYKDDQGRIAHRKRAIDPYIVPIAADEMSAYHHLRIKTPVAAE
jgi:succinate dehydrogenase/fumarate reductase flavoprotein subunit